MIKCPKCGSMETYYMHESKKQHCAICGNVWTPINHENEEEYKPFKSVYNTKEEEDSEIEEDGMIEDELGF